MSDESIKGFFGEYRWLSNFHLCPIPWEGYTWPSTEHAYQATKTFDPEIRKKIYGLTEPKLVKRISRSFALRGDWEIIKLQVMLDISRIKYQIPYLRDRLLKTQELYLEETNTWNDTFWGVCNGVGQNNLGRILMQIREEIR